MLGLGSHKYTTAAAAAKRLRLECNDFGDYDTIIAKFTVSVAQEVRMLSS